MTTTQFQSFNPATGEVLWQGIASNANDIDKAFKTAAGAFKTWSNTPLKQRIEHLIDFKNHLMNKQDLFAEAISLETGKPFWESKSEVNAMANKVDISIESFSIRCHDFEHQFTTAKSLTRHRPHGIVAIYGPYNFPGHLPNGHIVPALLAGNTVVYKPSELTPFIGELMIQFWKDSGLPDGLINLVQGGPEVGKMVAMHNQLNGLFFTGSWPTGKLLAEQFATQPEKILALEMGGNNPLVFHDVENIDAAVYHTIQSAYATTGQRCTCARRLIVVEDSKAQDFVDTLVEQIQGISIGPYTDNPEPFMGPLINKKAADKLLEAQNRLIAGGGNPLCKMRALDAHTGFITPGLIDVTAVANRPDEEYFGPLLQLIRVPSLDRAIAEANNTAYGLVAGILSDDRKAYDHFYKNVKAGVINWNTQLTGASSSAPFGGIGHSGNFRPSALYAADYCSYPVASMENETLQIPQKRSPGLLLKSEL
jgi:succinylglutamic semialdehyde dehydrogenase